MRNKILLVEDTEEILSNLRDYLTMEGLDVMTARNGKEALKLLEHYTPDLIITDLLMDEMTGFELVSELKKNKNRSTIKIIVFSARPKEEDEEITQLDIDLFILKPANPEFILKEVKKLLSD